MLEPAPPFGPSRERPWHWVILGGVLTSALALFGVHWLDVNSTDFNIMGWYANYVIPIGAGIVGVVAGSGYGAASYWSGVKISRQLLWIVVALLIAAYLGAQYVEFRGLALVDNNGNAVGFLEYLDLQARSFAWKQRDGSMGQPLGIWGYLFRLLEVAGFVLGGLILTFVMRSMAYCDGCQIYMRSRSLAWLAAGIRPRRVKKKDQQAQADLLRDREEAHQRGQAALKAITDPAVAGRASDLRKAIATHDAGAKECGKLEGRIQVNLVHCPSCHNGRLEAKLFVGQASAIQQTALGHWDMLRSIVNELETSKG